MKADTLTSQQSTKPLRLPGLAALTRVDDRTSQRSLPALKPQKLMVDIVIPVYNEDHSLPNCIATLDAYMEAHVPYKYRITIADNGSKDSTWDVAQLLAKNVASVRAVHMDQKGRGRALKAIWSDSNADILAYMDVDLSTGLESFLPLIEPLVRGEAGIATGSRLQRDSQTTRSFKRETISRVYNWMVRRSVRTHFSDAQCGFKAIRKEIAKELLPSIKDMSWFFDTELLAKAERKGWTVHEVPVQWIEDTDSRVNIVKTATDDIKGLARLRREFDMSAIWETPAYLALLLGTLALYVTNLSINSYANSYYSAAVQAASTSWKAWFFGSLDGASFITVDKPPVATWIMGLSARVFGFSSFSMLLPSALAGVATVALVYASVKRLFGSRSALIAGVVMALTPVAALMFRFNNPDSFLTFFLTLSGYFFIRALEGKRAMMWLSLAGLATGFAFNTKMLQGLIVLPIMAMVYLCLAQPKLLVRIKQLAVAGVVTVASTLWWAVAVWLTPITSRPYIGSSSSNSIWDLIMGYNGFGRLLGKGSGMSGGGGFGGGGGMPTLPADGGGLFTSTNGGAPTAGGMPGGGGGMGPGGTGFGGETGILRIFNTDFGPNIAWLIPLALISAGLTIWLLRRTPRDNRQRAAIILWTGWLVLHAIVFSITSGTIHPYYPIVMAPAIAALIGIGAPYIWKAYNRMTAVAWVLPLSITASAVTAFIMLGYSDNWPWLSWAILATGGISSLMFFVKPTQLHSYAKKASVGLGIFTVLAAPIAFTFSTVATAHSGSIPTSGPSGTAVSRTNNESAEADTALVQYLLDHRDSATWIAAAASANESAPLQISSGEPVMAVGGFNGGDAALTLDQFKTLVSTGKLKYYVASSSGRGGGGPGGGNNEITSWVTSNGTQINYGGTGATLYELNL
jgi:4-amino-4-deoxy-L-arabinose transferase-like glycosyltransferase